MSEEGVLVVANTLAPGQIAIAGTDDAIERASGMLREHRIRKGVRLLAKRVLKGRLTLPIWTDSVGLHVMADVVWSKKIGFRQYEVGLRFVDLSEDDMERLRDIALEYEKQSAPSDGPIEAIDAPADEGEPADDPRLGILIDAWMELPDAVKAGIVAMAEAARGRAA